MDIVGLGTSREKKEWEKGHTLITILKICECKKRKKDESWVLNRNWHNVGQFYG